MLNSLAACNRYISTQAPSAIASKLRQDQERCRAGQFPSLLALALPKAESRLGDEISLHLQEHGGAEGRYHTPRSIRHLQYEGVVNGIKAHIEQLGDDSAEEFTVSATVPTTTDFEATLKVLEYLMQNPQVAHLQPNAQLSDLVTVVRTQLSLSPELRSSYRATSSSQRLRKRRRRCYICHFLTNEPHELYPSLCKPCGAFNLAESNLSLPGSLNLTGKIALVTGGRVALGFHTALRLLRCGARVIVSSRYPRDAETRYREESDFEVWEHRLRVVGADFRTAKDVFRLVTVVQGILAEWHESGLSSGMVRLDVLVNNAAQTLTDTVAAEKKAVSRELLLMGQPSAESRLVKNDEGYTARVRGGTLGLVLEMNSSGSREASDGSADSPLSAHTEVDKTIDPIDSLTLASYPAKSSWAQLLTDIPYEDVITAHSVNTFVPFILCREFLPDMTPPNMRSGATATQPSNCKPHGYIINVSSREGLFEASPTASVKNGHHVHTNMSKAALNMLTETEAARAWNKCRVAMNTVDPGYMSAAPEFQSDGDCPIGFEDGAARVLWPVAIGESKGEAVWGRFLKHFGETKVHVGLGR